MKFKIAVSAVLLVVLAAIAFELRAAPPSTVNKLGITPALKGISRDDIMKPSDCPIAISSYLTAKEALDAKAAICQAMKQAQQDELVAREIRYFISFKLGFDHRLDSVQPVLDEYENTYAAKENEAHKRYWGDKSSEEGLWYQCNFVSPSLDAATANLSAAQSKVCEACGKWPDSLSSVSSFDAWICSSNIGGPM